MTILVGRSQTREGIAAFEAGIAEARIRNQDVVVFDLAPVSGSGEPGADPFPAEVDGVALSYRAPDERSRDAAGDLLDAAQELDAALIVIGVRHRSPVGKLLLGSSAQQIILEASAPVLAVKAVYDS
ncbi:universal stress protein [Arthrobacter gengyunqii]|uniref:Universal stress protein n=1 Tax=Arthrobacter gengyunqii TaxID=2886940 RepID=A0ABS8GE46_9MICC|nr:universal stress protein [Arthrobacter gengyunqii]MCC3264907.1 universal stress protein [Arthrobacter gengyunqii]